MNKDFDIFKYPHNFFINITGKCNLRCVYCSSSDFNDSLHMTKVQLESILFKLKAHGTFVCIVTGGEPMLHPDFQWFIEELSKFSSVSINTNGLLIKNHINFFESFNNKKRLAINISLDSLNDSNNAKTRGIYDVDAIVENTKKLASLGYKTSILLTVTNEITETDLIQFDDFRKKNDNISVTVNDLKSNGRANMNWDKLVPSVETIKLINQYLSPSFINYDFCNKADNDRVASVLSCGAGKQCLAISENGDVFPCTALYMKIGNIFDNSVKEMCDSSQIIKDLNDLRNTKLDKIPGCSNCDYIHRCGGGCRANAFAINNDILSIDPYCWHFGNLYKQDKENFDELQKK